MNLVHWLEGYIRANGIESLGVALGLVCVWLLVKANIWNWPIGIANNILYIYIFFVSGLFADMGLQLVYIAISVYGWWNWLHGGKDHSELEVTAASASSLGGYVAMTAAATAILYFLLHRFTPSTVPLMDGLTTALFLTAQYMMSRKIVENWWFWIVGDVLAIGLYIYKGLDQTAGLYTVFMILCVMGLREWQKASRRGPAGVPVPGEA
jgi:nicotinamide mononucleotide transporter